MNKQLSFIVYLILLISATNQLDASYTLETFEQWKQSPKAHGLGNDNRALQNHYAREVKRDLELQGILIDKPYIIFLQDAEEDFGMSFQDMGLNPLAEYLRYINRIVQDYRYLNLLPAPKIIKIPKTEKCSLAKIGAEKCNLALKYEVNGTLREELNELLLQPATITSLANILNWDDNKNAQITTLKDAGFIFYKENVPVFSPAKNSPYIFKAPATLMGVVERKNISRLQAAEKIGEYQDPLITITTPRKQAYFLRHEYMEKYPDDSLAIKEKLPEVLIVATKITEKTAPLSQEDREALDRLEDYLKKNHINIEMTDRDIIKTRDGKIILMDTEMN